MPDSFRTHTVILPGPRVTLRPFSDGDWLHVERWYQDPEVLFFSEGGDVARYSPGETRSILTSISKSAYCFVIEFERRPVGEVSLQRMNHPHLLARHPGLDVRRLPITIGDKACWGRGLGTEAIGLLVQFAFDREGVDVLYACGVGSYNPRSLRAFEKNGFKRDAGRAERHGGIAVTEYDLCLDRNTWSRRSRQVGD